MCPSFVATRDEQHTTRARANALRVALSNRGLLNGLGDDALHEVLDLCVSCKACKSECPTGVDMAALKAELLSHRNRLHGVSPRSRFLTDLPRFLAAASWIPRLTNALAASTLGRAYLSTKYGFDRRIAPARLARQTFRSWFRKTHSARAIASSSNERRNSSIARRVIYFVDTWTNYCTPEVGIAAVTLLERAGYRVHCPVISCCGRPAISQGLLSEATELAEQNIRLLTSVAPPGVPIVGTEPSCLLTLVDEYPQLVRTNGARRIASQAVTIESFLAQELAERPDALTFAPLATANATLLYHGHCHQKALVGTDDVVALLSRVWGDQASLIDAGCCGMAGSFGHEAEHYDVAKAMGEDRLFPAIRKSDGASVAISGFSCRTQIAHHTAAAPRHLVEFLADSLR